MRLQPSKKKKKNYLRAKNFVVVAMALGKNSVSTRQRSLIFLSAKDAFLETFLRAPVLLFASLLHSSAFLLTLIILMIRIFFDVAFQCASVAAFESNIAR